MNKKDLVAAIAERAGLTKKDAEKALDAFTATVVDALKKGEKVNLVGFGVFEVRERKARIGRNPQTGAAIQIPATKVPAFRPGKGFKESI